MRPLIFLNLSPYRPECVRSAVSVIPGAHGKDVVISEKPARASIEQVVSHHGTPSDKPCPLPAQDVVPLSGRVLGNILWIISRADGCKRQGKGWDKLVSDLNWTASTLQAQYDPGYFFIYIYSAFSFSPYAHTQSNKISY